MFLQEPSFDDIPNVTVSLHSPPPSLSPPLSHGVTHPMSGSLNGVGRGPSDQYPSTYTMSRPILNHAYSNFHDTSRYGGGFPSGIRTTDNYGATFSLSNGPYPPSAPTSLDQPSRSSHPRQDGPPFEETKVIHPVLTARNQQLMPDIAANIQKGFFQVDQKWTCYRRNYFTVSCSFNLRPSTVDTPFYLQRSANHTPEIIGQFAVSISAKTAVLNTNQESETRALVQHTPKRDKATESIPGKVIVQPAVSSLMPSSSSLATSPHLYTGSQHGSPGVLVDYNPNYGSSQHQAPPGSHTFERIQFQKATANNGKRRAQQQYFHIVVELSADVGRTGDPQWVKIATKESHPMVVRGRSPGHYKDNGRRGSSTSMDPDQGAGAGGDSGVGTNSMHGFYGGSRAQTTTSEWDPLYRGNNHMGRSYRQATQADCSPTSIASSDASPASSADFGHNYQGNHSLSTSSPEDEERTVPRISHSSDIFLALGDAPGSVSHHDARVFDLLVPRSSCTTYQVDHHSLPNSPQTEIFPNSRSRALCHS